MPDSAYITVVRRYRPHDQGLQDYHPAFEAGRLETASEENVTDETNGSPRLVGPRSTVTEQYVPKWKQLLIARAQSTPGQPLVCPPASCLPASWPWSPAAS